MNELLTSTLFLTCVVSNFSGIRKLCPAGIIKTAMSSVKMRMEYNLTPYAKENINH